MTVGKCSDFKFNPKHGFTGSAGKTMVKGYARGGKVKHDDAAQDKVLIRQEIRKALKK
jgi:hypothetical protein